MSPTPQICLQERGLSTQGTVAELKLRVRLARKAAAHLLERSQVAMVRSSSEFLQRYQEELRAAGIDPQQMKAELELEKVRALVWM
jgi:hypothetical protein